MTHLCTPSAGQYVAATLSVTLSSQLSVLHLLLGILLLSGTPAASAAESAVIYNPTGIESNMSFHYLPVLFGGSPVMPAANPAESAPFFPIAVGKPPV